MCVNYKKNILYVDGKEVRFENEISQVVLFKKYIIVLIMDDNIPDNNVFAVNYQGEIEWNISAIISFSYAEAYVSADKIDENTLAVVSYNGVKYLIDIPRALVLNKNITK